MNNNIYERIQLKKFRNINHKVCNQCLDNKLICNFKDESNICNYCMLPEYVKARNKEIK